jgi:hypothetical protein
MAMAVEIKVPEGSKAPVLLPEPEQTGQPGPHCWAGESTANPSMMIKKTNTFLRTW